MTKSRWCVFVGVKDGFLDKNLDNLKIFTPNARNTALATAINPCNAEKEAAFRNYLKNSMKWSNEDVENCSFVACRVVQTFKRATLMGVAAQELAKILVENSNMTEESNLYAMSEFRKHIGDFLSNPEGYVDSSNASHNTTSVFSEYQSDEAYEDAKIETADLYLESYEEQQCGDHKCCSHHCKEASWGTDCLEEVADFIRTAADYDIGIVGLSEILNRLSNLTKEIDVSIDDIARLVDAFDFLTDYAYKRSEECQ